jgi:abortive infection bacteriophage resistance protein
MKQPYTKPALSIPKQIDKLIAHGMVVPDRDIAAHVLQHISYYRLSVYWLPFENAKGQAGPRFKPDTQFPTVLALYEFDRKLRLLMLDAVERIEVALRGGWAYEMAMRDSSSHGYLDSALYADRDKFDKNFSKLAKEVERSRDAFMIHYKAKYSGPAMPPVWMASELLSLGQLSQWYAALKEPSVRQAIAKPFGLDEQIFVPFAHHLSIIRNICAHHGRLWNRRFPQALKLPKRQPEQLAAALNREHPKAIYNTLAMVWHVLSIADPKTNWPDRLTELMATLPIAAMADMGFPQNWMQNSLWSSAGQT